MKHFIAFFYFKIINGYITNTFTFSSKYGNFTDEQLKHNISELLSNHSGRWLGELKIERTARVPKREYDRINKLNESKNN